MALIGSVPVFSIWVLIGWALYSVLIEMRHYENRKNIDEPSISVDAPEEEEMIVQTANGGKRTMALGQFEALYEPTHLPASGPDLAHDLMQQGFQTYLPKTKVWARQLSAEDVSNYFPTGHYISGSGSQSTVCAGMYIVMPFPQGKSLTICDEAHFSDKYMSNAENNSCRRVLSQAETLQQWDVKLRRNAQIYTKTNKVHAKIAINDGVINKIVNGFVEASESYAIGDYIVCGSRGGKHPMSSRDFSLRYDTANAEPGTDRKLATMGFKLFKAQGKIWSHRLAADDVANFFPDSAFFGKWGGLVEVATGDAMAMPYPSGGEVYCIKAALFDATYGLDDRRDHVPTQDEMVCHWATVLQNDERSIYRESDLIFAKTVLDEEVTIDVLWQTDGSLFGAHDDGCSS